MGASPRHNSVDLRFALSTADVPWLNQPKKINVNVIWVYEIALKRQLISDLITDLKFAIEM